MTRPLRIVTFSTLYPSASRPHHALFVEKRLSELLRSGSVEARVVAPVPWFASRAPRFGSWAQYAATPHAELRQGVQVLHPRYLLPPKVGETVAPLMLAAGAMPAMRRLERDGFDFDLIDAHYYYPDGVAAALLGRWLGKPTVITARGSDLNVLGRHALPRRMMRWAATQAAASIGVSEALVATLRGWGVDSASLHVMRNGVDLEHFRPLERADARARLRVGDAPLLLVVGHLVDVKGPELAVEALALLARRWPGLRLAFVGDGPLRGRLQDQASALAVAGHVQFVGSVAPEDLPVWYSAADATLLASRSEGWPNVLLESMACGTPVVATAVGGSVEIVGESLAGALVAQRTALALADAVDRMLADPPQRAAVRCYASSFSWHATTQAQLQLFAQIAAARTPPSVAEVHWHA